MRSPAPKLLRLIRRLCWAGLALLLAFIAYAAVRDHMARHPEDDPTAPLSIHHPAGWATAMKLTHIRRDAAACRLMLERDGIGAAILPPAGEGQCRRTDRLRLKGDNMPGLALTPGAPETSCAVAAGLALWMYRDVQPAARDILGSPVARLEHLGTYSCRRIYGGARGNWSEHARANAIDISAFVLTDGRRISLTADWNGTDAAGAPDPAARFLHRVRDGACAAFGTVLSPDYNAQHADHLHLDQAQRGPGGYCR